MAVITVEPVLPAFAAQLPPPGKARPWLPLALALGLITVQLCVRSWIAANGEFYWDDLILAGRAGSFAPWSPQLLLHGHDGHFMPFAFLTAWIATWLAPLSWAPAAVSMLLLQLVASLAVLRMALVLAQPAGCNAGPWRYGWQSAPWIMLAPLCFYLFCPLTLPAFAWWSAALNALPLQIALAWVIADAILLIRTQQRRFVYTGATVFTAALLFFEKAVLVPFTAFLIAVLVYYLAGHSSPLRWVLRRAARLWTGSTLVLACWLAVYGSVVGFTTTASKPTDIREILHRALFRGMLPALAGGPWDWARLQPAPPLATPPGWAIPAAALLAGLLMMWSVWARRHAAAIWAGAGIYVAAVQLPVAVLRGGTQTAPELMQSMRYLADVAVVLTAACVLLLTSPARRRIHAPPAAAIALTTAVVASSLWSTVAFTRSWTAGPQRAYLANLRIALPHADTGVYPLLDQEVPWEVLSPAAYPQNLASRVTSGLRGGPIFATSTPRLRMITNDGKLAAAQVWWNRAIDMGPVPGCGHQVRDREPAQLPLNGPMLQRDWTAQLNYVANRPGWIFAGFAGGSSVRVPVQRGMHTVFVRLTGGGSALRITPQTSDLSLCIGAGPVGVAFIPQ